MPKPTKLPKHVMSSLRKAPPAVLPLPSEKLLSPCNRALESLETLINTLPDSISIITDNASPITRWIKYFLRVAAMSIDQNVYSNLFDNLALSLKAIFQLLVCLLDSESQPENALFVSGIKETRSITEYAQIFASLWFFCLTKADNDIFRDAHLTQRSLIAPLGEEFHGKFVSALPLETIPTCLSNLTRVLASSPTQTIYDLGVDLYYVNDLTQYVCLIASDFMGKHAPVARNTAIIPLISALKFLEYPSSSHPSKVSKLEARMKKAYLESIKWCLIAIADTLDGDSAGAYAQAHEYWSNVHDSLIDLPVAMLEKMNRFSIHRSVGRGIVKGVEEVLKEGIDVPRELGMRDHWVKLQRLAESGVFKEREKVFKDSLKAYSLCRNGKCPKKRMDIPMLCSGCQLACYCSAKCQKAHWPEHKESCRSTSKVLKDSTRSLASATIIDQEYFGAVIEQDSVLLSVELKEALNAYLSANPELLPTFEQLTVELKYDQTPPSINIRRRNESDHTCIGGEGGKSLRNAPYILKGIIPVGSMYRDMEMVFQMHFEFPRGRAM
ncbi:uncharacterized protein C8R40DRAFT_1092636 [Lentinula edodes]|uniref:uncharacterized protein n=1 Tax=Lentinula edodes TaxID=5353 RepID=UPI001E8D9493|nr:uncharacterized protein C8R40DRAFT_1092636 [Lentinula edodes]KAH7877837.1 hypothetical protein C8R40DRAFT_1092636 [Lentinula edodes]